MKRFFCLTSIFILLCVTALAATACTPDPNPCDPTAMLQKAKSGVAQIECGSLEGSGFLIRNDLIVTNFHVVAAAVTGTSAAVPPLVMFEDEDQPTTATLIGYSRTYDLAVLKLPTNQTTRNIFEFDTAVPTVGENSYSLGMLNGTFCAIDGMVSAVEILVGVQSAHNNFLYLTQIAATSPNGTSGGPSVDINGKITGINGFCASVGTTLGSLSYKIPANIASAIVDCITAEWGMSGEVFALDTGFEILARGEILVTCLDKPIRVLPISSGMKVLESDDNSLPVGSVIQKINGLNAGKTVFLTQIIKERELSIFEKA